jgi:hypothetical protein
MEESKMSNHGKEHNEKMCAMTCCPCNINLDELKELVRNPGFICKSCGRVAEKDLQVLWPCRGEGREPLPA